ncbi:hypothetical protein [Egicoccus sp. AB-alg2]|uniref:hypothetical protein n=1 Tax=Egicoccus sp. AB-alg2 TaxID=3242693 RepID=UPI00359DB90A
MLAARPPLLVDTLCTVLRAGGVEVAVAPVGTEEVFDVAVVLDPQDRTDIRALLYATLDETGGTGSGAALTASDGRYLGSVASDELITLLLTGAGAGGVHRASQGE